MKLFGTLLIAALGASFASADQVKLKLVPTNGMPIVGGYMPQRLAMSKDKPADLKKAPFVSADATYGVLDVVGTKHIVIQDGARILVDSNGNGDLTDDPAPEWKPMIYGENKEFTRYSGKMMVDLPIGGKMTPVSLGIYNFDAKERPPLAGMILYFSDYAMSGEIKLGGKTFKAALSDMAITGYQPKSGTDDKGKKIPSGINLLIDVNGNGKFDRKGESFDVTAPFNIGGTTYEISNLKGETFAVGKSSQTVAEILPPPDMGAGKKIIGFNAKTTDGTQISFPSTYKGKLVMLDFWATWCGPCKGEIPGLAKAYEKYHPAGFEILGISLDNEKTAPTMAQFTKDWNMPWQQICDAKYWDAEIAKLYVVQSIPAAYLVDGDTGEILASGDELRGNSLVPTLEKALAKKKKGAGKQR